MKRLRISALVLALMLMLSGICLAEGGAESPDMALDAASGATSMADISTLPDAGVQDGAAILEPLPELVVQTTQATEAERERLYILMADCGYSLYGSSAFDSSVVSMPGDPEGHVMGFLKQNMGELVADGDAKVVVYGYHSDFLNGEFEPVLLDDSAAVAAQFDKLINLRKGDRMSSKLDKVMDELCAKVYQYQRDYDCTVIFLTGGVLNHNGGTPDQTAMATGVQKLHDSGAAVHVFGLDVAGLLKEGVDANAHLLSQYFPAEAYHAAAIAATETDDGYARARIDMMNGVAAVLAGEGVSMIIPTTNDELTDGLLGCEPGDKVIAWGVKADGSVQTRAYLPNEIQAMAAGKQVSEEFSSYAFWLCDVSAMEAAAAQGPDSFSTKELEEKLSQPLMLDAGAVSFPLNENYDPLKHMFSSDNTQVLEVHMNGSELVLTPRSQGRANLLCNSKSLPVEVLDLRINWTWNNGEVFHFAGAALNNQVGIPSQLSASVEGNDLYWTVKAVSGRQAGMECSGNTVENLPATMEGLGWTVDTNGAARRVVFTAGVSGSYEVHLEIRRNGNVLKTESRSFSVERPIDAVADIELMTPYFKEQPGQRFNLTSGGAAVSMEDYNITVEPAGALELYYGADGSSVYVSPKRAGSAAIVIMEKDIGGGTQTRINVLVKGLGSNIALWLCGAGIAICLIGLTAGVVILIGKNTRKPAKRRTR